MNTVLDDNKKVNCRFYYFSYVKNNLLYSAIPVSEIDFMYLFINTSRN